MKSVGEQLLELDPVNRCCPRCRRAIEGTVCDSRFCNIDWSDIGGLHLAFDPEGKVKGFLMCRQFLFIDFQENEATLKDATAYSSSAPRFQICIAGLRKFFVFSVKKKAEQLRAIEIVAGRQPGWYHARRVAYHLRIDSGDGQVDTLPISAGLQDVLDAEKFTREEWFSFALILHG